VRSVHQIPIRFLPTKGGGMVALYKFRNLPTSFQSFQNRRNRRAERTRFLPDSYPQRETESVRSAHQIPTRFLPTKGNGIGALCAPDSYQIPTHKGRRNRCALRTRFLPDSYPQRETESVRLAHQIPNKGQNYSQNSRTPLPKLY
jgi:hypothetical protein